MQQSIPMSEAPQSTRFIRRNHLTRERSLASESHAYFRAVQTNRCNISFPLLAHQRGLCRCRTSLLSFPGQQTGVSALRTTHALSPASPGQTWHPRRSLRQAEPPADTPMRSGTAPPHHCATHAKMYVKRAIINGPASISNHYKQPEPGTVINSSVTFPSLYIQPPLSGRSAKYLNPISHPYVGASYPSSYPQNIRALGTEPKTTATEKPRGYVKCISPR